MWVSIKRLYGFICAFSLSDVYISQVKNDSLKNIRSIEPFSNSIHYGFPANSTPLCHVPFDCSEGYVDNPFNINHADSFSDSSYIRYSRILVTQRNSNQRALAHHKGILETCFTNKAMGLIILDLLNRANEISQHTASVSVSCYTNGPKIEDWFLQTVTLGFPMDCTLLDKAYRDMYLACGETIDVLNDNLQIINMTIILTLLLISPYLSCFYYYCRYVRGARNRPVNPERPALVENMRAASSYTGAFFPASELPPVQEHVPEIELVVLPAAHTPGQLI